MVNQVSSPTSSSDDVDASEPLMETLDEAVPMEETPTITAMQEDGKPADESHIVSGSFEWVIKDFSRLDDREFSDTFEVAGHTWRLMMFPRGNRNRSWLSVFLDCPNLEHEEDSWSVNAAFDITLVNQQDEAENYSKPSTHVFDRLAADWGFSDFVELNRINDPTAGWLVDDQMLVKVEVRVNTRESSCYDSKKETGFVGLKNQGATCYLNSWLQTLFNINCFRQAVFHIPTTEEDEPSGSISLALQSLFYKLQFGSRSVSTKDLTKSFGWDQSGAFMQEDVHEFNKILCDALEKKMKGTKVEGVINRILEGHILKFIECLNVDYKSTKRDAYMDIFLDVKGCKNVYESFDRLTAEEKLEGDNQYNAEGHGLQDAKIGDLFDSFPPVLQLHLKRFEYDFERDVRVKINDRYEFPEELDLDVGDRKYLSKDADASKRNKFKLHSVLVHSGGTHGGHYYAYSRPDGTNWLCFDDEKVTREDGAKAVEEQYGGEGLLPPSSLPGFNNSLAARMNRFSSAYMLLYIREEEWDTIMCNVPEHDVALHLRRRLQAEAEQQERELKEAREAHRYTVIRVATTGDIDEQIGDTQFMDLVDFSKVRSFRIEKTTLFGDFRKQLAEELGVPLERQRLWHWQVRSNKTLRPSEPVPRDADSKRVRDVRILPPGVGSAKQPAELLLWLQDAEGSVGENVLVFLKQYDPRTATLKLFKPLMLGRAWQLETLAQKLCAKFNIPADRIQLDEEVYWEQKLWLENLKLDLTLNSMQPEHGDIIIFSERLPKDEAASVPFPDAKKFLEWTLQRRRITFKKLQEPKEAGLQLDIRGDAEYEAIVQELAEALQLADPQLLRLTQHNQHGSCPKNLPVRWRANPRLDELAPPRSSQILYYEVLDLPLAQLEQLRTLQVALRDERLEEQGSYQVRLKADASVADVLDEVAGLAGADWAATPLRLLKIKDFQIFSVFEDTDTVELASDSNRRDGYWQLEAHAVPADESSSQQSQQQQQQQQLMPVCHITPPAGPRKQSRMFEVPFMVAVSPADTVGDVRQRIQARLGVPDDQFTKWQLKYVAYLSRPEDLDDDDALISRSIRRSGDFSQSSERDYLALEHPDSGPKRQKRASTTATSLFERPMKIG